MDCTDRPIHKVWESSLCVFYWTSHKRVVHFVERSLHAIVVNTSYSPTDQDLLQWSRAWQPTFKTIHSEVYELQNRLSSHIGAVLAAAIG